MLLAVSLLAFSAAGMAGLFGLALREHRAALVARARLLDPLVGHFAQARITVATDGFPTLTARLPDRRELFVELVPDTLVVRRLPQLWLCVTLRERFDRPRASLGALARPTGAEFYSQVLNFPERLDGLPGVDGEILLRGDRPIAAAARERVGVAVATAFADRRIKEVAATPRGVRVVRQADEGERGAHLLLRQIRFVQPDLGPDAVAAAIDAADLLRDSLDAAGRPSKVSA